MRIGIRDRTVLLLLALWLTTNLIQQASANPSPFYMGGDISLESYMQGQFPTVASPRARFFDNGVEKPMDRIMYDHGANMFRLRVFVNPQVNYTTGAGGNIGAIQTNAYDIALAQQIKTNCPNAKIMLDFHYSDTWADPGRQNKPQNLGGGNPASDWRNLDLPTLNETVREYTRDTLLAFQDAGVMPDVVQIGNETTGGMLWQTGATGGAAAGGRILFQGNSYPGLGLTNNMPTQAQTDQSWRDFGGLLNSAIAGVREVQGDGPRIPIALSIDRGDAPGQPQYFYERIQSPSLGAVTDFDIQGVDFYPSPSNLIYVMDENLTELANTNYANFLADSAANPDTHLPLKRIMLLENNYPWRGNSLGEPARWARTPAGQMAEFQAVRDLIYNLPHDVGMGVLWWYPEAVVPGANYNNGNTALFDSTTGSTNHNGLPALDVLNVGDYNRDGVVDAADYTVWRNTFGSTTQLLANGDNTGTSTGVIDQSDYDYWRSRYANNSGASAGGGSGATVPEPAAAASIAISWLLGFGWARFRRDGLSTRIRI
jgi:arabinogalactan endo-1,4-beta-galactosidase